ncbi:ABC transporter substrate-binding protein [Pseudoduganella violacea]|uniref:ABC-type branched-subunit amino acid transport system substrate-binding protein n=1 Tax=Pseudoduganella violacea TaxID=1715466 RepID=A0A7W5BEL5_9BURK|nr:ABC transporter substrate-binding protein [Pseudoduganella violacea]MBB3121719.1 ABC-type branched-subunit amino acid transport system substrate-binding protein [Pseudoduganella violacea]
MGSWLGCCLLAGILVATASHAGEPGVSDTQIRLGMVNAQSGAASGLGRSMLEGATAVFEDVNHRGGVHGRRIELVVADDGYDPDRAVDQTLKMIEQEQVFSLFGYVGTPTTNAVIPIVQEMKVPLVGAFTGAMALRQPVVREIINFRASYDDETDALVHYFVSRGVKRFGVMYQDDGFGQAVLGGTERALQRRSLALVAKGSFQRGTTAVKAALAALIGKQLEVVVMVGPYTPVAAFVREANQAGLNARLATVSFVGTDSLLQLLGTEGNGILISQVVPLPDDRTLPIADDCAAVLAKQVPDARLSFVNFEGCIAARAMVAALLQAGAGLTRERLLQSFEAFDRFDIGGLQLTLRPDNHQASTAVFLTRIVDGKIVPVGVAPRDK